jgi:hypothetical protein
VARVWGALACLVGGRPGLQFVAARTNDGATEAENLDSKAAPWRTARLGGCGSQHRMPQVSPAVEEGLSSSEESLGLSKVALELLEFLCAQEAFELSDGPVPVGLAHDLISQ